MRNVFLFRGACRRYGSLRISARDGRVWLALRWLGLSIHKFGPGSCCERSFFGQFSLVSWAQFFEPYWEKIVVQPNSRDRLQRALFALFVDQVNHCGLIIPGDRACRASSRSCDGNMQCKSCGMCRLLERVPNRRR